MLPTPSARSGSPCRSRKWATDNDLHDCPWTKSPGSNFPRMPSPGRSPMCLLYYNYTNCVYAFDNDIHIQYDTLSRHTVALQCYIQLYNGIGRRLYPLARRLPFQLPLFALTSCDVYRYLALYLHVTNTVDLVTVCGHRHRSSFAGATTT